ncbi:hypothetical protein BGW39_003884, partial [Mortierella sp. 14UC]
MLLTATLNNAQPAQQKHLNLLDVNGYFQNQQRIIFDMKLKIEPQTPHGSKRSKTSKFLKIGITAAWSGIQQDKAENLLMRLVAVDGPSFNTAVSILVDHCKLLNSQLRKRVAAKKQEAMNYIHANIDHGAITTDTWTCKHNKRKCLGVAFHYIIRNIGMEIIPVVKALAL